MIRRAGGEQLAAWWKAGEAPNSVVLCAPYRVVSPMAMALLVLIPYICDADQCDHNVGGDEAASRVCVGGGMVRVCVVTGTEGGWCT